MGTRNETDKHVEFLARTVACLFLLAFLSFCSLEDMTQGLLVCAPFLALMVPGYFDSYPAGGITHGTSCYCLEADDMCEFGFWFQIAQKMCLILPVLFCSILIFYVLTEGVWKAIEQVALAIWATGLYACVFASAVALLIMSRNR